jgi:hypothetical protein
MRALITATLAVFFVTTLGIAAFAIGDEQRVPSPAPDAVATGMVRKLATSRVAQTQPYLSSYAREQYTAAQLTDWIAGIERTTGKINRISTADVTIGETLAATTLAVRGQKKTMQVRVNLVRESGTWKVERLPEIAD